MITPERLKEIEELAGFNPDANWLGDLSRCSNCGGVADNGHDRCGPPSAYFCKRCDAFPELLAEVKRLREELETIYCDKAINYMQFQKLKTFMGVPVDEVIDIILQRNCARDALGGE